MVKTKTREGRDRFSRIVNFMKPGNSKISGYNALNLVVKSGRKFSH